MNPDELDFNEEEFLETFEDFLKNKYKQEK